MKSGYEEIEWIRDDDGKEYACYLEDIKDRKHLSEEEKEGCLDVNNLVGTERW